MRFSTVTGLTLAAMAALAACSEKGPYLDISGGGFVFNYRLSEAYEGFIAAPLRTLPDHARIEATFENPAGGPPIVMAKDVVANRREYSFTTDALHGIKADRDYDVTVRLVAADGTTIETIDKKCTPISISRCSPTSRSPSARVTRPIRR